MLSLHSLPVELLDDVCSYLQGSDLVAISRTNSILYSVAQRLLYRDLFVGNPFRNLSVIVPLAQKPHLARHVRKFNITLDTSLVLPHSLYGSLADALSHMTELVSLEIFVDSSQSWVLPARPDVIFPRLSSFSCSFPLDSCVTQFLSKTAALLELQVDALTAPQSLTVPDFPKTLIPRLSIFTGSLQAAQAIVPGRPVDTIYLNSGDLTEDIADTLAKSTAAVYALAATTSSLPLPILGSLAQSMPDLQCLRLMTTYNFWEFPPAFIQNIANSLTSMKSMKTFELSGRIWGFSQKALDDDERRVWESDPQDTPFLPVLDNEVENGDFDIYFVY